MNAIVLAGGRGTRLAPWPAPKCLLPVNGVPILSRLLKHVLEGTIVDSAVVCVGYRGQDVVAAVEHSHLGAFEWDGVVQFSDEGEDAPMGRRLLAARKMLDESDRALICYGDELADVSLERLVSVHESRGGCSMSFAAFYQKTTGGVVVEPRDADGRLVIDESAEALVNIGFVVVEPECWAHLRDEDGLSDWINRESLRGRVGLYRHYGKRATVNSLVDLKAAEELWR